MWEGSSSCDSVRGACMYVYTCVIWGVKPSVLVWGHGKMDGSSSPTDDEISLPWVSGGLME
jgi:hypothetical protein